MAASGPILEIAGITLGLREAVIGLIAFVALYMLVVLLRMRRLRGKKAVPAAMAPVEPVAPDIEESVPPPVEPAMRWNEPPDPREAPTAEDRWQERAQERAQERVQEVAQEVAQLRDEVDALRGELAALRDDMLHELAHLRAAQTVSPIYGDAMQMAVSGCDPALIAERCGIARAEAELVVALAKSQNQ